jgi:uncharacterized protein YeaO (DUF488 family)
MKDRWMHSKKTEKDWQLYERDFNTWINRPEARAMIEQLATRSSNGEIITLLCYCRQGQHCHRDIVKTLIEKY